MAQEKKETKVVTKSGTSSHRAISKEPKKKKVKKGDASSSKKKTVLAQKTNSIKQNQLLKEKPLEKTISTTPSSQVRSTKERAQEKAKKKSQQANAKKKVEKKNTEKKKVEVEKKETKRSGSKKKENLNKKKNIPKKEKEKKNKKEEKKAVYISPKQYQKLEKEERKHARPRHQVLFLLILTFLLVIGIDVIRGLQQGETLSSTSGHDILNDVLLDKSDIVVVGSSDFQYSKIHSPLEKKQVAKVMKYDSKGTALFEKAYDSEYNSTFQSVILVSDGYVAVGSVDQKENDKKTAIIVKYDKEGNLVWENSEPSGGQAEFYEAFSVADGIWVVGAGSVSQDDSLQTRALIAKYNFSGQLVYEKLFDQDATIYRGGVVVGDYLYAVGKKMDDIGILSCYTIDGVPQWTKEYEYTDSLGFTDIIQANQSLYITGAKKILPNNEEKESRETNNTDALLLKYSYDGNLLFEKVFGGSGLERYHALIPYGNNLFAVGFSSSKDSGLKIFTDGQMKTGILVKFDFNGNMEGKTVFGGSNNDYLTSITTDKSNLYLTASTNSKDGNIMTSLDNGRDRFGRLIKVDSRLRVLFLR